MFKVEKHENRIERLGPRSFSELGFRERAHLQEWIANKPDALGEELLIIQKEFSGFSDTSERLDLLAVDKQGSLVIIENKLDDTGRDVTWQALKYASYCARLTKDDIRDIFQSYLERYAPGLKAEDQLCAFLDEDEYQDTALIKRRHPAGHACRSKFPQRSHLYGFMVGNLQAPNSVLQGDAILPW